MRRLGNTFNCPVCGEEVPNNAKSCPECGACEKSGWSGEPDPGNLGLPDDDFDYEKFTETEFGSGPKKAGMQWLWWVAALILLIAFALAYLPR